jgi:hypothetical protein
MPLPMIAGPGSRYYPPVDSEPFTPDLTVDFDGLADQANVSSTGTAGKRFGFWGTYATGYGTRATTASAMPGKTSSARMTIQSGNDGGEGGGTGPNGSFGGGISAATSTWPAAVQVPQGGELWLGLWIKPQPSPNYLTNTGSLKFLRTIVRDSGGTSYGGKVETLLTMDGSGNHTGFNLMNENDAKAEADTVRTCDRLLIPDSWNWFEIYFKPSAVAADCTRRVWVNDELSYERTLGEHNKWHQSGSWQEADFASSTPETLLEVSTDTIGGLFLATYWNGNAPSDQRWDIQSILAHSTAADLTATDEFGNKMMGSGAYV